MGYRAYKHISVEISAQSGIFLATTYVGTLEKLSSDTRFLVTLRNAYESAPGDIEMTYKDGSWTIVSIGKKLKYGRWEAITLPYNVPSDGFISVYLNPSTTAGAYVRIASGGGNPSITAVAISGEPVTTISPVRKNDYFSQQLLTNGSITCRFMPIFQE